MASTFCVSEPNDPLRVLLPSLEVTQAPVGNGQFEKVSCSSQEEQIFAFCYPETVGKTSIPVADCNTLSPTLSPIRENHSIGNTSTPSFRRTSTSEDYLPMSTRSPYAVSDCVASNHSRARTALLHATPSPRPCKSERSTAIKRYHLNVSRLSLMSRVNPKGGCSTRRKPRRPVNPGARVLLLQAVLQFHNRG